jgi:hypothetical protein
MDRKKGEDRGRTPAIRFHVTFSIKHRERFIYWVFVTPVRLLSHLSLALWYWEPQRRAKQPATEWRQRRRQQQQQQKQQQQRKSDSHGSVHHKCIFRYNQQDATLQSVFISAKCSTCFRWALRPSSGAQDFIHSIGYLPGLTATCRCHRRVGTGLRVQRHGQAWQVPDVVYKVLSSWWWAEDPPETCRAFHRNKYIV